MRKHKYVCDVTALAIVMLLAAGLSPAWASTTVTKTSRPNNANMQPFVSGQVTTINGNILTVTGKQGFNKTVTPVVFTVNTTNAKVIKGNSTSTVANIIVGDTVRIQGNISGTNIAATMIHDGEGLGKAEQGLPNIPGNGQPVVAGAVTAINGTTLTITNKSNATYTIDASNAKIVQGTNSSATISNITIGDTVMIQGTVNGNAVVASTVIDRAISTKPIENGTVKQSFEGFFKRIGLFFSRVFGF